MAARRKAAAEQAPARQAPPRKVPAKKAPLEKAPAKKAPAKKVPGGKAPAQKMAEERIEPHSRTAAPFAETFRKLRRAHPDAHCELDHQNAFQLLVATVLSAQSTDVVVNQVTPALFARWPDAQNLANAEVQDVEQAINRLGMYRQKAKNLVGLARGLVEKHGGEVPGSLDELVALPGVGRKTANVVLGVAFGTPEGVVVDTHVQRITQRLGWTCETAPDKIERGLMQLVPRQHWDLVSHVLIFHGRRICTARKPACPSCPVNQECPSAFRAEQVGRKPPRARNGSPSQASAVSSTKQTTPPAKKASPAAKKAPTKRAPGKKTYGAAPAQTRKSAAPRVATGSRRTPS